MTAERSIAAALIASILASLALPVVYVLVGGNPQVEGILLAIALGGLGLAIVIWAIRLLEAPVEEEPRHEFGSTAAVEAAGEALDLGSITRRRFLGSLLAGAGGLLAAALVLPAFSLGPHPTRELFETAWRKGSRVVGSDGRPIRPDQLTTRSRRSAPRATSVMPTARHCSSSCDRRTCSWPPTGRRGRRTVSSAIRRSAPTPAARSACTAPRTTRCCAPATSRRSTCCVGRCRPSVPPLGRCRSCRSRSIPRAFWWHAATTPSRSDRRSGT